MTVGVEDDDGVLIELLVVPDCPNAAPARALVEQVIAEQGLSAEVVTTVLATDDEARSCAFAGSPTFLVDGVDPFPAQGESTGLSCRVYPTRHGLAGVPDKDDLTTALLAAAGGPLHDAADSTGLPAGAFDAFFGVPASEPTADLLQAAARLQPNVRRD